MLFEVVSIQPSERWVCEIRNSSIWPLKGSAMPLTMPSDAKGSWIEIDGQRIAHLRDTRAVQIETLVVRAGVLVVGADDIAPGPVSERARDVVLQAVLGPEEVPGEAPAVVVEDVAALLAADDGSAGPAEGVHPGVDGDPIGVLDRRVVGDDQARAIVEENAPATPEGVVLDGRAGNVIGAVHPWTVLSLAWGAVPAGSSFRW